MFRTTSLRKSFIYLESVSSRKDLFVILRIYNRYNGKATTLHCNPEQALNHLFLSQNKLRWMKVS